MRLAEDTAMITAIVRYRLPRHIDRAACRNHYESIAPGFRNVKGLISKHFLWSDSGVAGGVYQWQSLAEAKAFYAGPWRKGIVERYGMEPEIEYFTVFCITDNADASVRIIDRQRAEKRGPLRGRSTGPAPAATRHSR
jgi:hypothetical protein